MKSPSLLLAGAFLIVSVADSNAQYFPEHVWSHGYGDTGTDAAYGVAVDISARAIVVGSFEGTIDLGYGPLTSAGSTDVFVVLYGGTQGWSRRFGGPGADVAYGVVAGASYFGGSNWVFEFTLTGAFADTVSFGGGDLVSAGGRDGFVVRLDGAGNHVWSARFGGSGDDVGRSISNLGQHEVTIAGSVTDPQLMTTDVFLARYDAAGTQVWSHTYGGPLDDVGQCISGGVVTGEFRDQALFGGSTLASAGGSDIFVARYDTNNGAHLWSQRFGGSEDDAGLSLYGSYCTGYFRGTVDFGGGNLVSAGGEDIFLLKLSNGVYQSSRRYGGPGNDAGTGISFSSGGSGYELVGRFEGTVNFGLNALTSAGGSDGFLSIITETGVNRRNVRMGGPGDDTAHGVSDFHYGYVPESTGYDVAIVGSFSDTIDLGGGPLVSAGGNDGFDVFYSERWLTPVEPGLPTGRLSITSFPNPFNPITTISYSLPSDGLVTVAIYDVNGARVATPVRNEYRVAGPHDVRWQGRTDDGVPVASGVYFAQIEHNGAKRSTRLVMLK